MDEKLYVIKYDDYNHTTFIVKSSYLKEFLADCTEDDIKFGKIRELDLSSGYYEIGDGDFKDLEDFIDG